MNLVLERRVAAFRDKPRIIGNRLAQRLDPGLVRLGEVAENVAVHQFLDTGMTDAESHPAIIIAEMRGDRAQSVVTGNAAADLHPNLCGRQLQLVVKHGDVAEADLEEIRSLAHRAPGLVHERGGLQQDDTLAVERAFGGLPLKAAAPR